MPSDIFHVTAEQVIAAVEAAFVRGSADSAFIEQFCDLPPQQAVDSLSMAEQLGLLKENGGSYVPNNGLTRFAASTGEKQKAAVLRIVLEQYEPFVRFRERLRATQSADQAARHTKSLLGIGLHPDYVKETLISLGTYTNAIRAEGGGKYSQVDIEEPSYLLELVSACESDALAEAYVREKLTSAGEWVSRSEVIVPLARALQRAIHNQNDEAVTEAGNAVESFLVELATKMTVNLAGATGINSKLDKFKPGNKLPKKIAESGKFLGHIRNAADHGIDTDIGSSWTIQSSTGLNYVQVAISFINACCEREKNGPCVI